MKRVAILLTIAIVCVLFTGNISANQTAEPVKKSEAALVNYTWYADEDMTDPVGTISDMNTELNRLRNLFPAYVFSATPSGNLHPFEYGYYPYSMTAIIYSDL